VNRLRKSDKDKVFDGVCGGIGEYLKVDPVIIRLLWVVLVIFGGTGVLAYLVAMIIIPKSTTEILVENDDDKQVVPNTYSHQFWGILLVVAGLLLFIGIIGPISGLFAGVTVVMGSVLWPLLVIGLGLYLFFNQSKDKDVRSSINEAFPEGKKLYKSGSDKRVAGVCGGIAAYFNTDSNIIRIFWAMATLGSFGFGVLAYLGLAVYLTEAE